MPAPMPMPTFPPHFHSGYPYMPMDPRIHTHMEMPMDTRVERKEGEMYEISQGHPPPGHIVYMETSIRIPLWVPSLPPSHFPPHLYPSHPSSHPSPLSSSPSPPPEMTSMLPPTSRKCSRPRFHRDSVSRDPFYPVKKKSLRRHHPSLHELICNLPSDEEFYAAAGLNQK